MAAAMVWSRSSLIKAILNAEYSSIVTAMKPVVHGPWYQVLP